MTSLMSLIPNFIREDLQYLVSMWEKHGLATLYTIFKPVTWIFPLFEIPFLIWYPTLMAYWRGSNYILFNKEVSQFWFFFVGKFDIPVIRFGMWHWGSWTITFVTAQVFCYIAWRKWRDTGNVHSTAKMMWWTFFIFSLSMLLGIW